MKNSMLFGRLLGAILPALLLAACSGSEREAVFLAPQFWDDVSIVVEARPAPLRAGMVEFLVIATRPDRSRAHDMIVSLRSDPDAAWQQAIQDGKTGVYRRAVRMHEGPQNLYVRMQRSLEETTLAFPMEVAP